MKNVRLGKTEIIVNKNGFGALPIQRIPKKDAVYLLQKAYDGGIRFFDTARAYTDSEEKLGEAFAGKRNHVILSSKTKSITVEGFWKDLETTLTKLKTDYLDIYQFHNPSFCPLPGDESGLYDAMLKAKEKGMILHIGITNHRLHVAETAITSTLYDTLQFPFGYLSGNPELNLVKKCGEYDVGFISMKALSGGLITNASAAYAFQAQFPETLPIWGIQRESELDQFLSFIENPPVMTAELAEIIAKDREELSGEFCRGCGYCMPCPARIEIDTSARMSLLRRSPSARFFTPEWQEKMKRIEDCKHCNSCKKNCPYGLDTPSILKRNYEDYMEILNGKPF